MEMLSISTAVGMLPIPGCFGLPSDAAVPASTAVLSWSQAIPQPLGGYSELRFSSRGHVEVSSGTATPILPTSRSLSTVPKCASPKRALSTEPCARPTGSASARSRKSVRSLSRRNPPANRRKLPPQPANGNNCGPKVRDRLCQLIRQHQLDPNLVKAYATDFCGVKTLREATREQVENFVAHLADWAEKDRNALLCQLNSYLGQKEGAA